MTLEFIERVRQDYERESTNLDWDSYLSGYWAAVQRFGAQRGRRQDRGEIKSELGYSRVGLKNT